MSERRSGDNAAASTRPAMRAMRAGRRRARLAAWLCIPLLLTIIIPPRPRLVWNASASAPIGLYAIGAGRSIATDDMVLARVPERWRRLAAIRRYIPINVPLVKRVAAEPGDTVCAAEAIVFVNGRPVAERRRRDGVGRPLPWWNGCVTLRRGALLLLMDAPESFDGRYFGPTARGDIIGEARRLWERSTRGASDD